MMVDTVTEHGLLYALQSLSKARVVLWFCIISQYRGNVLWTACAADRWAPLLLPGIPNAHLAGLGTTCMPRGKFGQSWLAPTPFTFHYTSSSSDVAALCIRHLDLQLRSAIICLFTPGVIQLPSFLLDWRASCALGQTQIAG